MNISSLRKKSTFIGNRDGAALIEFAFIAPVLLLLIVGAMEYGIYFLKSMSSSRALAAASQVVVQDPADPSNRTFANRDLSFGEHEEHGVCAKAFRTLGAAEAGTCAANEWSTEAPAGHDGAYYVTLAARGETAAITGLFTPFLPNINHKNVVKVNPSSGGLANNACPPGKTPEDIVREVAQKRAAAGWPKSNYGRGMTIKQRSKLGGYGMSCDGGNRVNGTTITTACGFIEMPRGEYWKHLVKKLRIKDKKVINVIRHDYTYAGGNCNHSFNDPEGEG